MVAIGQLRYLWLAELTIVIVGLATLAGCSRGPVAPALEDGPEFRDAQEGFRFLVPEHWTQYAHAAVPPGRLTDERMIVEYNLQAVAKPASFGVTCVDLDPSTDIAKYVASHVPGGASWKLKAPSKPCEIQGVPAEKMTFVSHPPGADELTRDIVAFRRGQRVYLFTGVYATSDKEAREQVQQAMDSILW
ncbi:MAG TPA: hypothetical protein VFA18_09140 [Gemmataceae bacterium]|nr:hypothetical protein [Gemmataceae bacterium]